MLINNPVITGSFLVNGVNVAGITGSSELSSSFLIVSASYATTSASFASASGSLSTRVTNLESTSSTVSSSFATTSGSISSRVNIIETSYATTGSNNFTAPQQISDTSNAISFTSTASLYTAGGLRVSKDSFVSGTAYFNNVVVYGTSSIQYITSSQVNIGTNIITVNTDTPAVRFGGLAVFDSGSTGLTGSILWDSQANHWVYSNPSGSTYSGGMLISGPRAASLGTEVGTTACALMMGQGGDHITSSGIFSYGNATCFYGNKYIDSSGNSCQAGTITGTTLYGATTVCSPSIISSGTVCSTGNACFGSTVILAGNVGIGTASPGVKLHVSGSGTTYAKIQGVGNNTTGLLTQNANKQYFAGTYYNVADAWEVADLTVSGCTRLTITSTGISCFACQTCAPGMDIMPSGIGVSTLGGIMRVVTTGTSTGIAVGQSNANRYTHFAANDIQVFNDDFFLTTRCAFPLSIGTCYTARLTFAATGEACFRCQVCTPKVLANSIEMGGSATSPSTAGVGYGMFGYSGVGLGIAASATGPNQGMAFFTCGDYERMRITTAGNVIVCTTDNQGGLTVTSAQDNTTVRVGTSATGGQEWRIQSTGGTSGLGQGKLFFKVGTTEAGCNIPLALTTDNGANGARVGIGIVSPEARLHIDSSNASPSTIQILRLLTTRATNNCYGIELRDSSNEVNAAIYSVQEGTNNRGSLVFGTNNGTGGNGLGSTTPQLRIFGNGISCFSSTVCAPTLVVQRNFGALYNQTSTTGTTSIVDTGIFYNTALVGFGTYSLYQLTLSGNPNAAGSSLYANTIIGYVTIVTGFDFGISSVIQQIAYSDVVNRTASNVGGLTVAACFWNGSAESSQQVSGTTTNQIRIKITGYNSSFIGVNQDLKLTKLL